MDNWRDPWADDGHADDRPSDKGHVASPPPPLPHAPAPAPVLLNAFVDDAGWGSSDGSALGRWATSPPDATPPLAGWSTAEHTPSSARWDMVESVQQHEAPEHVTSDTSDSAPTVVPDGALDLPPAEAPALAHPDDSSSAPPSTSPSEAIHNDVPAESPRSSFEEEKPVEPPEPHPPHSVSHAAEDTGKTEEPPPSPGHARESHPGTTVHDAVSPAPFCPDATLMAELFPPPSAVKELGDAPDDPIYSTEARKAWYRLTRKQTMREYNAGNDADNYIRVNWANSHIRLKVSSTVARWAREDRISGTGAGARASFYWDTTAPPDLKSAGAHVRTASAASNPTPIVSVRQSMPPLPSNSSVAFDWTSPPAPLGPWQKDTLRLQLTSPPLAPKLAAIAKLQGHGNRSASVDLTPRAHEQALRRKTAQLVHETTAVRYPDSPPPPSPAANSIDPWANLDKSSITTTTTTTAREESLSFPTDDDDDWGEMVQSPAITRPHSSDPFSHRITHNETPPISSLTPQLADGLLVQDTPSDTMHSSPIVRLQSTISPTSTLFKKNSFVPLSIEPGPIGPGLLKSASRLVGAAPENKTNQTPKDLPQKSTLTVEKQRIAMDLNGSDDPSIMVAPTPQPSLADFEGDISSKSTPHTQLGKPLTLSPQSPAVAPTIDSWADADFSFFESSVSSQPPASQHDVSDSFSIFDAPSRNSSPAHSCSRSPPRNFTPPSLQPLTGATTSAQRRKMDEDQVIKEILFELPSLTYMLR